MKTNTLKKIIPFILMVVLSIPLQAQDKPAKEKDMSYDQIEKTQDNIEKTYIEIYDIIEQYPEVTYDYIFENGKLQGVSIQGMPANADKNMLEVYLMDLENMKENIFNLTNRVGVYYVAESEPKPKNGYDEFYENLHGLLSYPENAEDLGIEGTVYVKFVVNREGEITNAIASEAIETDSDWVIKEMKNEAVNAVKATSGQWIPGSVAGIPVAHWVVIPVQFSLQDSYYRPIFGESE